MSPEAASVDVLIVSSIVKKDLRFLFKTAVLISKFYL
jgi:hypothetical protein